LIAGYEARDFTAPDAQGKVAALYIRATSETGELVVIKAAQFVLAAGTQESTRILLRNIKFLFGLGFTPPALGRYYQGHLSGKIASVRFKGNPKKRIMDSCAIPMAAISGDRFQFTAPFLAAKNLLNTAIWLDNPLYYNPRHRSGAMSFMYLAMLVPILGKKLAPPAIAYSITSGKKTSIGSHLANILRGLPGSLLTLLPYFTGDTASNEKLPGVFLYSPQNHYALHFHAEQVPDTATGWNWPPTAKRFKSVTG